MSMSPDLGSPAPRHAGRALSSPRHLVPAALICARVHVWSTGDTHRTVAPPADLGGGPITRQTGAAVATAGTADRDGPDGTEDRDGPDGTADKAGVEQPLHGARVGDCRRTAGEAGETAAWAAKPMTAPAPTSRTALAATWGSPTS